MGINENIIVNSFEDFKKNCRHSPGRLCLYMVGALLTIPFNICIENIAVIWGMLGNKNGFYVVKKDERMISVL